MGCVMSRPPASGYTTPDEYFSHVTKRYNADAVSSVSSNDSSQIGELWEADVALVRNIWAASNPYKICLKVIIGVLVNRPILLGDFGLSETDGITVGELAKSPRLQSHAQLMADFFSEMLESLLESVEAGEELTEYVGSVHFKRSVKFTADNYLVFKQQFVQQLCAAAPAQLSRHGSPAQWAMKRNSSTSTLNSSTIRPHTFVGKRSRDDSLIVRQFSSTSMQTMPGGFEKMTMSPRRGSMEREHLAIWRLINFMVARLKNGFLTEAIRDVVGEDRPHTD